MSERWVLATSNRGKVTELEALLRDAGYAAQIVSQSALGVEPAPEDGLTFLENALSKARHASRVTGLPAIADDSGLVVDALGGAPGIRSARYAGPDSDDAANIAKLLGALDGVPAERRGARFVCVVVALTSPEDPLPLVAMGEWRGVITTEPRGLGGFGYDPVFVGEGLECTAAEIPAARKNALSHRGKALRRLAAELVSRR